MAFLRNYNIELAARNLKLNFDWTPDVVKTWDADLWRGTRLLVPVHVKALVVTNEENGPWADMRVRVTETEGDAANTVQRPTPFTNLEGSRALGIYLHWTLPDALTKGAANQLEEEPTPSMSEVGETVTQDPIADEVVEFPLVPDRWLVVRISPGASPTSKRRIHGWVIESEEEGDAAVTPWYAWEENRSDDKPSRWLTAVGKGDPAYMAYYDNVENILGFYDDMSGIEQGLVTYMVAGWYSERSEDPLFAPENSTAYYQLLNDFRWSVGEDGQRIVDVAKAAQEAANQFQLDYQVAARSRFTLSHLSDQSYVSYLQPEFISGGVPNLAAMMDNFADMPVSLPAQTVTDFNPLLVTLAPYTISSILGATNLFQKYYPRQMLCHGTVYNVAWNGAGGEYDVSNSGIPSAGSVDIAIGNTYLEALAAALAERSGEPELERLLSAQHYGLLPVLNEPDGIAKLESLLHAEDFASKPGGYVVETIEQGDFIPPPTDRERFVPEERQAGSGKLMTRRKFIAADQLAYEGGMLELKWRVEQPLKDRNIRSTVYQTRKEIPVRRALPRFWQPKDPAILVLEPHRAFVHGEDGRFTDDNTLPCRLTTETVQSITVTAPAVSGDVTGKDISNTKLASGQLPPEIQELLHETLLMDPTSAPVAVQSLLSGSISSSQRQTAEAIYQIYVSYYLNIYAYENVDAQGIASLAPITGVLPLPIAMLPWQRPWTPLHLEWEVAWYPTDFTRDNWLLKEHDFEYEGDSVDVDGLPEHTYVGRTLLTPSATEVVADRIAKLIEAEDKGGTSTSIKEALGQVLTELNKLDALTTSLSGLHEAFIGQFDNLDFDIVDAIDPDENPDEELFEVRAGHLTLTRLRIVDAYGQIYEFDTEKLQNPIRAEDMRVSGSSTSHVLRLNPRIVQPSRAMFRMLQADDDSREASKLISPVCGWVLPDHMDESLEIYDSAGISLGQVQTSHDLFNVEWQGVPGTPQPMGAPPIIANSHLRNFVEGLLSHGNRDRAARDAEAEDAPNESALSALLRMIDATLWTVDPIGRRGDEHLSVLVGRPLALVRAELQLELEGDAVTEELLRTAFPFRLGAVNRLEDGLMGYFVNNDYSRFYPVHETIAAQTRPSGPNEGFLGPIETVPDYYHEFETEGGIPLVDPVTHPYIDTAPVIYLRPAQKVLLTMLVDPRGGVHLTSGILPRKKIELMREQVASALDNLILTFRVDPVLTDPEQVRMPLPEDIKGGWSWIRRTDATVWEEVDVVDTSDEALLPDIPPEISEGWLKLSSAFIDNEDT